MFDIHVLWAICFFLLGALWGSFANVVILRLPKNESVVFPSSHCVSCNVKIRWYDNIPIFSWLILRGKCRACKASFSIRYSVVELITAILFCAAFLAIGFKWYLIEVLVFFIGLVIITFIDIDLFLIPDKISLPGIVIGLIGAFFNPNRLFLDALYGALLGGGFLYAIAYIYFLLRKEEGMGGGDIKLLAWIGAVCGWKSVPFVILVASVLGSFVGIALILKSKKGMKSVIPFGPYLALAAVLYVLIGGPISSWYLQIFFPWM